MNIEAKFAGLEVGYDVPAIPGMSEEEIQTPCLILDLDALDARRLGHGDGAVDMDRIAPAAAGVQHHRDF